MAYDSKMVRKALDAMTRQMVLNDALLFVW